MFILQQIILSALIFEKYYVLLHLQNRFIRGAEPQGEAENIPLEPDPGNAGVVKTL